MHSAVVAVLVALWLLLLPVVAAFIGMGGVVCVAGCAQPAMATGITTMAMMAPRRMTVVVLVLRRRGYNHNNSTTKINPDDNDDVRRVIEAYCGQLAQQPQQE